MPGLTSFINPELVVPDFTNKYNTPLSWDEEVQFQREMGNRVADLIDYDLRGAWREMKYGNLSPDQRGHLDDKYKKPNHPTFSTGSMYNGKDGFIGGEWIEVAPNQHIFKAGKTNFYQGDMLRDYFDRREPGNMLIEADGNMYTPLLTRYTYGK